MNKWHWQWMLWHSISFFLCRLQVQVLLVVVVPPWQTVLSFPFVPKTLWRQRQRHLQTICIPLPKDHLNDTDTAADDDIVDAYIMQLALSQAQKAADRGEVPIGAVVVRSLNPKTTQEETCCFQVLSMAGNRVEECQDASAHAELLALRQAARRTGTWRLLNATLYTSVEPCPMCLAAAQGFRIQRIVYGAPDLRVGAIDTYLQLLQVPHPYHNIPHVTRGVGQNASADMLRNFFRQRRRQQLQLQQHQQSSISRAAKTTKTPWQRILSSWRRRRNKGD
jgi:tRNA(adenine34) deaminase